MYVHRVTTNNKITYLTVNPLRIYNNKQNTKKNIRTKFVWRVIHARRITNNIYTAIYETYYLFMQRNVSCQ